MKCIYCSTKNTAVLNSRPVKNGDMVWRRRSCDGCGQTFTTKEDGYTDNLFVIKSSGKRQRFVYEKLFISIFTSLNIRKHPDNGTNAVLAKNVTERVIKKIYKTHGIKDVESSIIAHLTYHELNITEKTCAEHYAFYSDNRQKVILKL